MKKLWQDSTIKTAQTLKENQNGLSSKVVEENLWIKGQVQMAEMVTKLMHLWLKTRNVPTLFQLGKTFWFYMLQFQVTLLTETPWKEVSLFITWIKCSENLLNTWISKSFWIECLTRSNDTKVVLEGNKCVRMRFAVSVINFTSSQSFCIQLLLLQESQDVMLELMLHLKRNEKYIHWH